MKKSIIFLLLFISGYIFAQRDLQHLSVEDKVQEFSVSSIRGLEVAAESLNRITTEKSTADLFEGISKWKIFTGIFQTGKIYKGSLSNPDALIKVPGAEELAVSIKKGNIFIKSGNQAVIFFPSPDKMLMFLPSQKLKLMFSVDAKNKHIQMDDFY